MKLQIRKLKSSILKLMHCVLVGACVRAYACVCVGECVSVCDEITGKYTRMNALCLCESVCVCVRARTRARVCVCVRVRARVWQNCSHMTLHI